MLEIDVAVFDVREWDDEAAVVGLGDGDEKYFLASPFLCFNRVLLEYCLNEGHLLFLADHTHLPEFALDLLG